MVYSSLSTLGTSEMTVTTQSGETRHGVVPARASSLLNDLRVGMHEEEGGTWYIARYRIERPGRFSVDFDYETEPEFDIEIDLRTYYDDVNYVPRAFEKVPDWHKAKLLEAHEMIRRAEGGR